MPPRWKPWIPVLVWGGLIFTFSTGTFTSAHTASTLVPVFHWLLPRASETQLLLMNHITRKGAHLFEYFVLGWLLLRAVSSPERGWKLRWALLALLIASAYAGTDEFHQRFVPGRDPSFRDSLIDATGASLALATAWFVVRYQRATDAERNARPS